MSRFTHLELDGESEDRQRTPGAEVKDEAFYVAEARTAFENGDFEKALRTYGKLLEFNPQNVSAWTGQVRMLIELGEFQDAATWADKALEQFPRDSDLLAARAVTLARAGDLQGAVAFSDSSIAEQGEGPYVWLARGDVLLTGRESRADYCFEKALMLARGDWVIAWLAGRIRHYHQQFALALKMFQQALESRATHFLLWLEVGRCQYELHLVNAARLSLNQARQLNPQCREAELLLIRLNQAGPLQQLWGWIRERFRS
jgi:tetratricopeptide (TPR) repeat protein